MLRIRDVFIPDPDPTIVPSRIRGVKKHRIPDPQHIYAALAHYILPTPVDPNPKVLAGSESEF
jgi:hypothetical protein